MSRQGVETAIDSVRQTMTDAGYLATDYDMVVMSYASPGGPDVEDNPDFPGWYRGGCLLYLADAAFARNKAVPCSSRASERPRSTRTSATSTRSACSTATASARNSHGPAASTPRSDCSSEHAFRQSLHPNHLGHGAFAQCITSFYERPEWDTSTCVDPASTGGAVLYEGLFEFKDVKNTDSGLCVDAEGYDSRNGTALLAAECNGGRNQGFWYDEQRRSLHVELTHDRCVDVEGGSMQAGSALLLWDCHGGLNQEFVLTDAGIHPAGHSDLCLGFDGTGTEVPMTLTECGTAASALELTARDYDAPVGYGYDDWIGASVY
ncbi:hypothetical protein GCM10029992_42450 [Glycomyces albus]